MAISVEREYILPTPPVEIFEKDRPVAGFIKQSFSSRNLCVVMAGDVRNDLGANNLISWLAEEQFYAKLKLVFADCPNICESEYLQKALNKLPRAETLKTLVIQSGKSLAETIDEYNPGVIYRAGETISLDLNP